MDIIFFFLLVLLDIVSFTSASKVRAMLEMNFKNQTNVAYSATVDLYADTYRKCSVHVTDKFISNKISDMLKYEVKMIEYKFTFRNYRKNPLLTNTSVLVAGNQWRRVNAYHGEVLLSLGENYGVMSLLTLTLGVESMPIELEDSPRGCFTKQSERDKIDTMFYLLMRDFKDREPDMTLKNRERVCYETLQLRGQYGRFVDVCCHVHAVTRKFVCAETEMNPWLQVLFAAITAVKLLFSLFGPMLFISKIKSLESNLVAYAVQLKDPLVKTICVCTPGMRVTQTYDKTLVIPTQRGFEKFRKSLLKITPGEPVKVKFSRYDILVNYDDLLVEHEVPFGLLSSLSVAIFDCRIRDIGPFRACCESPLVPGVRRGVGAGGACSWLGLCRVLSSLLMLLLAPALFYLRLAVYYLFEHETIQERHEILREHNLYHALNGSIFTTLTPTHVLFLLIYVMYFVNLLVFAVISKRKVGTRMKRILVSAFTDLEQFSWLQAVRLLFSNILWPFTKFGLLGVFIAPFYWAVFLPVTAIAFIIHIVPVFYVTLRLVYHAQYVTNKTEATIITKQDKLIDKFDTQNFLLRSKQQISEVQIEREVTRKCICTRTVLENNIVTLLVISLMYGALLLFGECAGFLVEMFTLTVMGIIVNAGSLLRYISLLILLIVYSYTAYSDVGKKYLSTLKSLFGELKKRCKDIEKVTSLPSHLQENFGFKSQELSEQADYELPDDIDVDRPNHLLINDLVLFVDSEDTPRLPKQLFQVVCEIQTIGAPGPLYLSLIAATFSLLKISVFVLFVFLVVAAFGSVYQVSSTNQMVATMAGGALPMMMRKFFVSEINTEFDAVSFRNKLEEIIKNFQQAWPIHDLAFDLWTDKDTVKVNAEGLGERQYYRKISLLPPLVLNKKKPPQFHGNGIERSTLEEEGSVDSDTSLQASQQSVSESDPTLTTPSSKRPSSQPPVIDLLVCLSEDGEQGGWLWGTWSEVEGTTFV